MFDQLITIIVFHVFVWLSGTTCEYSNLLVRVYCNVTCCDKSKCIHRNICKTLNPQRCKNLLCIDILVAFNSSDVSQGHSRIKYTFPDLLSQMGPGGSKQSKAKLVSLMIPLISVTEARRAVIPSVTKMMLKSAFKLSSIVKLAVSAELPQYHYRWL